MADDSLIEPVLDALAHLCALAALAFAARAARVVSDGWVRVPVATDAADLPSLSVVVPARNEAANIERCVRSLLAQSLAPEVIVVDDRSDDDTPEMLAALARESSRLHVVAGAPLPEGWVGKPWALAQGTRTARGAWLLFTDADTWHAPDACASTLAFALSRGADAVTIGTYQELGSWGERALLPTILGLVLLASGSMSQLNDPHDASHALANGQYILISRRAHEALGGHEALRGELVEDIALARRIKRDGRFRMLIAGGEHLVRVRMYRTLRDVWSGFTKNMYVGAQGDLLRLAGAGATLTALSPLPALLAVDGLARGRIARAIEALLVLGLGIAVQALGYRRTRLSPLLAWWAPVGYGGAAAILLNSTRRVLSGRGVEWRGRRYSGRVSPA